MTDLTARGAAGGLSEMTSGLTVQVDVNAADARSTAAAYLAAQPVLRNVVATTTESLIAGGSTSTDPMWCSITDSGGNVVGVAMHTPPFGAALTDMPAEAAELAARELHARDRDLPSASGPEPALAAFARVWAELSDLSVEPGHDLGVFALDELVDPPEPPGGLRRATHEDADLLVRWTLAFGHEAGLVTGDPDEFAARILQRPAVYLWDDGGAVSMVAHTLPGGGVVRVGPVYTPAELRGRGYGTAATAAVSRLILAAGHRCMLFTDLANPTSNGIYQRIGYRRVGESRDVRFVRRA